MIKKRILIFLAALTFGASVCYADEPAGKNRPAVDRIELSLEDVVHLAISNNIDVKLARYDALISSTEIERQRSVFDTVLDADADYSVDKFMRSSVIAGTKEVETNYNLGLTKKLPTGTTLGADFTNVRTKSDSTFVTLNPSFEPKFEFSVIQELARNSFGLIDRGNVTLSRLDYLNATFESLERIENAVAEAEKSYWRLVFADDELGLEKEMLKAAEDLYNINKDRYERGLVEKVEMVASEANLAQRRTELIMAQNRVDSAVNALKLVINDDSDAYIVTKDKLEAGGGGASFDKSLKAAIEKRRDYAIAKTVVREKNLALKLKSNARWPQLDMDATFAVNGLDTKYLDSLKKLSANNYRYEVGFTFSLPLENREASSQKERAAFEKAKALLELEKVEKRIVREVDDVTKRLKAYRIRAEEYGRIAELERKKLDEELRNFKYGRSDSDTVIRFQEDLLEARLNSARSLLDYNFALIDLKLAEDALLGELGVGGI